MKPFITISLLLFGAATLWAQNNDNVPQDQEAPSYEPEVVFDHESPFKDAIIPAPQERTLDNILWQKTIWRMIDMREQLNFPFYFPVQKTNGRTNLFLTIFNLLKEGKVNAHEYFENKEDFTEETKLDFEEVLNLTKIDVYEQQTGDDGESVYAVNEVDVPTAQVLKFYIKETWYFDAIASGMKCKIEAIAPQLYYINENGVEEKSVLFWISFDELRPWLAQTPVMVGNKNSKIVTSFDELFQKRRFSGHIYKEDNERNRSLMDYCSTPLEVRIEQNRIENEILNFESDLWEY